MTTGKLTHMLRVERRRLQSIVDAGVDFQLSSGVAGSLVRSAMREIDNIDRELTILSGPSVPKMNYMESEKMRRFMEA